jgi:predicted metal-dependent HD superfamily phosphohydrolase
MFTTSQIITPREKLEAEILHIFADRPLDSSTVEFILESYSEPWRMYHNCEHILLALNLLRQLHPVACKNRQLRATEVMILYHDVVYKIGREKGWSEHESARTAETHLAAAGHDQSFIALVMSGITCTINHVIPGLLMKSAEFIEPLLDVDLLSGFGTSWDEFSEKTRLIGLEYSPLYTQEEYRAGRAKFAKAFLDRQQIFYNRSLREYEALVRENLQRTVTLFS